MKFFLILFSVLCFARILYAQKEPAFTKGNSLISAGIGIGNIWKTFLKDAFTYPPDTYKVTSKGTFTLVYEYGFINKLSGGIAIGYSEVVGKFNGFGEVFTETLTNFSILARANYHFGNFRRFDPYAGAGVGYYHFNYHVNKTGIVNSKVPGSLGYSAQLGIHYYFTSQMGAYAEAGYVGGSFGQIGFTYKL